MNFRKLDVFGTIIYVSILIPGNIYPEMVIFPNRVAYTRGHKTPQNPGYRTTYILYTTCDTYMPEDTKHPQNSALYPR